jgi:hypothetical protein
MLRENFESENLFNKINLLSKEEIKRIDKGLQWTSRNIPNAVLIGGTATIHYIYGPRELTPDIDFMIDNIDFVKTKLTLDNVKHNYLNVNCVLGVTVPIFNTDYLDSSIGNKRLNKLILSTHNTALIGGLKINIINPELLAIMKIELGRDKDISDGLDLLASGNLNKKKYIEYLQILKPSLNDYESIYILSKYCK